MLQAPLHSKSMFGISGFCFEGFRMGAKGLEQKLKVHGWRFKAQIFMALPDKGLDDDYKLFA